MLDMTPNRFHLDSDLIDSRPTLGAPETPVKSFFPPTSLRITFQVQLGVTLMRPSEPLYSHSEFV